MGLKLNRVIACGTLTATLMAFPGCVNTVDCDIEREHVHLYVDEESTLKRYIQSERERIGSEVRTDAYEYLTYDYLAASQNKLYPIEKNLKYLYSLNEKLDSKREELVTEEIVGPYMGYGHGLNPATGKFEYFYGQQNGFHVESNWHEIDLDAYTDNPVRDITYKIRLYKVNVDESIEYHDFDIYDVISEEYKFFKPSDVIQTIISDTYNLPKNKKHK